MVPVIRTHPGLSLRHGYPLEHRADGYREWERAQYACRFNTTKKGTKKQKLLLPKRTVIILARESASHRGPGARESGWTERPRTQDDDEEDAPVEELMTELVLASSLMAACSASGANEAPILQEVRRRY